MTTKDLTVPELERWVLFGADWRLVELSAERAIVDLCACTGELVERRESNDTALIGYLRSARPAKPETPEKRHRNDR